MIEKILEQIDKNTLTKESVYFLNAHGIKFVTAGKMKEIVQEVAKEYDERKCVNCKHYEEEIKRDFPCWDCTYRFDTKDNFEPAPYQKGE